MNRQSDQGSSDPRASNQRMGRAYQASFEAVIAVVVGAAAGGYADQRFGTSPFLLIVGVLLGFGTLVLRLFRLLKELAPPPQEPSGSEEAAPGEDREDDRGSDRS